MNKEIIIPQKPVDEKISKLKGLIQKMNATKADIEKNNQIIKRFYLEIIVPLIKFIDNKTDTINPLFNKAYITLYYNQKYTQQAELDIEKVLESDNDIWILGIDVKLEGFISAGTKAFNVWHRLIFKLEKYKYAIGEHEATNWEERVYRQMHNRGGA